MSSDEDGMRLYAFSNIRQHTYAATEQATDPATRFYPRNHIFSLNETSIWRNSMFAPWNTIWHVIDEALEDG